MNSHFFNKHMARILGVIGLAPFVFLALATWIFPPDWQASMIRGQIGYGIAILSFLGGIHWGGALGAESLSVVQTKKALAWGVMPSFIAFSSLLVEPGLAFLVLGIGFLVSYQIDKRLYLWYKMPEWFLRLRFALTCVILLSQLLTLIAVNVRTH
jgi:hypothetical protein